MSFLSVIYKLFFGSKETECREELEKLQTNYNKLAESYDNLKQEEELKEPNNYGNISLKDLRTLLVPICPNIYFSDEAYSLTSVNEAKKFSEETKVMYDSFITEKRDCDEASFALMGYWNQGLQNFAFGICWSTGHAFNLMCDNERNIWIVEPQTNVYMPLEEAKKNPLYFPLKVIMI
jgi:hypothetical protein